jgi:uncharacterized damage-inducible protein DinB
MKLPIRLMVCVLVAGMSPALLLRAGEPLPSPQAAAGQGAIITDLLKDWQAQKSTLMLISDAMPADKFSYKPSAIQRSYGEQIMHVALINVELLKTVGGKATAPSFTEESAKNKADMLKALSDSYDYGIALLKEQTDASIGEKVRAPAFVGTGAGATFLGPSTRARIFWFLLGHSMDIYGQMVVYLRANGVVPPASRG